MREKIMPLEKKIFVASIDREVRVSDLSVGYLYKVQETKQDDIFTLFEDATDLTENEILKLRNSEAKQIRDIIISLTNATDTEERGEGK